MRNDLFTQEVLHEALISVVAEMRVTLLRTAFSSVIYEGQDFSCALADRRGRLACQSREDFPAHVGPLNMQVPQAIAKYDGDIRPGDVILANDPFTSGTHLNDVALISPIFWRRKLVMFACSRAHWGDVGGMTPGSVSGQTRDIFQEGVRIPILKLHDRGKPNEAAYELLFANMRQSRDRHGDLMSQLAAAKSGSERVVALVDKFGYEQVTACVEHVLDRSERRMREQIGRLPKGVYRYKDYLDSDGQTNDPIPICAKVNVGNRAVEVDFAGSGPQRPGPTNASLAVTSTAVFVVMKALLDPYGHINEGAFRPIRVIVPPGSLLNAAYPAPMGGFVEVLRRVEAAVLGALSRCVPDEVAGDTKGCGNHVNISHLDRHVVRSIHYEYPAGGTGGWNGGDGSNAVREWDAGDFSSIHSAEIVEAEHRCVVEECGLAADSGGPGQWRGGMGLRRVIRILGDEGALSVLSDRNVIPPWGVNGGFAGQPNMFTVVRDGRVLATSSLPGKVSGFPLRRNDRVVSLTAGGGGYGDPRRRARQAILRDVELGYVSPAAALNVYGATVDGYEVEGTVPLEQVTLSCLIGPGAEDDGVERFGISARVAQELAIEPGSFVELTDGRGAPLRGIARIDGHATDSTISVSEFAAEVMRCQAGQTVTVRAVRQRAFIEALPGTQSRERVSASEHRLGEQRVSLTLHSSSRRAEPEDVIASQEAQP